VTQGGDWGYSITRMMGLLYPSHVLAAHLNMVLAVNPRPTANPLLYLQHLLTPMSASERAGAARHDWFQAEGRGYNLLQSTKPHTPGAGLADSPLALLAWVLEKLRDWTDGYPWTDDEILTWVGVYAFSRAGPDASLRIYYERSHPADPARMARAITGWVPRVRWGLSYFPADIVQPRTVAGRTLGKVVYERRHEKGGHFAAWEVPELLAGDLRAMFGRKGGAREVAKVFGSKL
jgi:hypothetical protein